MIQKNISKSKIDLTSITENTDTVQKLIELQVEHNSKTLCVACFNILSKSSNKCESCGHCPKTQISSDLLYDDVPAEHPKEKPSIKIGEIIDENPNSRGSIKTVLEKLCEQGELGNKRKWVRPVFDGAPYRIATHLHNEVVQCLICQSVIDTKLEKIENHVKKSMLNMKTCLIICTLVRCYWLLLQVTWKKFCYLIFLDSPRNCL